MSVLLLLLGGLGLYLGGEWLVTHASRLALSMGLSPFVVGLTVVAFGTSAPELAATLTSTFQGANSMALGNVMGSNIANIALVLGATALITPIAAAPIVMRRDFPVFIAITAACFAAFYFTDSLNWIQGSVMVLALLAYIVAQLIGDRDAQNNHEQDSEEPNDVSITKTIAWLVLSLFTLALGARAMVISAVDIATSLGVSERIIGLTVVALGTSLPELASSIIAARRQETDLALGGVIGSNIFNLLGILGITACVNAIPTPWSEISIDASMMLGVALLAWVLSIGSQGITRIKGILLLAVYTTYIVLLF